MPDERISDASLQSIHDRWPNDCDVCRIIRELQQWRAAAKYVGHQRPCGRLRSPKFPCTCGYDDLPAWMRGGQ